MWINCPRLPARTMLASVIQKTDWGQNKAVCFAQVAELVDAIDSKSIDGNIMRVRFSPWALVATVSHI